ncbi:hypothetical protein FRB93_012355 [Tulasnella sp. JGI-2019a]|nr:hypothetical protein FRB93_012355 [Tulasnella sp. JGI-2019a]
MKEPIGLPKSTATPINVGNATTNTGYFSHHATLYEIVAQLKDRTDILQNIPVTPTSDPILKCIDVQHLACEYKQTVTNPNYGQLVYDLGAAQNQLMMLGLANETRYGIRCIKGVAEIIWPRWNGTTVRFIHFKRRFPFTSPIRVGHVTIFDLSQPSQELDSTWSRGVCKGGAMGNGTCAGSAEFQKAEI